MMTEQQHTHLEDMWSRYYNPDSIGDTAAQRADHITLSDLDVMHAIYQGLPEEVRLFVELSKNIEREYAKGYRCGVCGRTPAQSAAINYDCIHEC